MIPSNGILLFRVLPVCLVLSTWNTRAATLMRAASPGEVKTYSVISDQSSDNDICLLNLDLYSVYRQSKHQQFPFFSFNSYPSFEPLPFSVKNREVVYYRLPDLKYKLKIQLFPFQFFW